MDIPQWNEKQGDVIDIAKLWHDEAESGRVWLWGILDKDLALPIVAYMNKLNQDENLKAIVIYINCRGGKADQLFAIVDQMRTMRTGVVTVVHGVALSAGCVIAASGDKRLALPHARFLFHGASQFFGEHTSRDIKIDAEELAAIDEMLCEHMASVTKKRKSFWKKFVKNSEDRWFGVEEALEWGVIDGVIKP